ncbi:hypothetical protein, partial [Clostridium sp. D53t1_180928_C8]|uniref:hypothetical protein n=1 Tax=Clostridium sp. D53t1_180928_C8 TaxID=2787101 RepID=UPI0018A92A22
MELRKILIILCIILMIPNGINISAMQIKSEICIKTEDEAKIEGLIENQKQYLYDYNADEIKKLKEVYKNINNDKKIFNKIKLTKESKKELKEYFNKTYKELSTAFK